MKTPNRFEQMVTRAESVVSVSSDGRDTCAVYHREAVALLRRQHRAYVQLVKGHSHGEATRGWVSTAALLDAFARYKKGKKP